MNATEGLVRWRHPVRGMLRPDLFIPMAEETGHIRTLTDWVLRQAIEDQITMAKAGHDLEVSINVSGRLLGDRDFADFVDRAVKDACGKLCFEITETAVIENPEVAFELLDRFRGQVLEVFREMGEPITALKKIREKLKDLPKQEIDWTKLETEFAGAHPEFRTKLLQIYPQLTSQQVKMCLLIHLNLKNHEIARLASLSERSVEKHRLNIRRLMKLKNGEDLAEALRKLDGRLN